MSPPAISPRAASGYPLRIISIVLLVAFFVEGLIMIALAEFPQLRRYILIEAVVDALLLTCLLAPTVWVVVVRPIRELSRSRGQLLLRLFDAQEQERGRLARDLHDELGQHLTAILVGLRTVEQASDLAQARERAGGAAQAAAAGLDKVRRIVRGLRPTVLEDLGLGPAIERLCEETQRLHGVTVSLSMDTDPTARFPEAVEMCLYRVLQESLTNAVRHAAAGAVSVHVAQGEGSLGLTVTDNGRGFDPAGVAASSFGLPGMRERTELLGGRFELRSQAGQGTTITVELPLAPPNP